MACPDGQARSSADKPLKKHLRSVKAAQMYTKAEHETLRF